LLPKVFPIKNEIYEPIITPTLQYSPPKNGPYIKLPTMQIMAAGTGKNTTCAHCIAI
jgi:hypothetical protein